MSFSEKTVSVQAAKVRYLSFVYQEMPGRQYYEDSAQRLTIGKNRGAYSTKERMPSERKKPFPLPARKAVHDWLSCMTFRDVLPSRQQKVYGILTPAHPRFTRMYGVTNSIAFQAIPNYRNTYTLQFDNADTKKSEALLRMPHLCFLL